jgi:glucose uptake protein GlcU
MAFNWHDFLMFWLMVSAVCVAVAAFVGFAILIERWTKSHLLSVVIPGFVCLFIGSLVIGFATA